MSRPKAWNRPCPVLENTTSGDQEVATIRAWRCDFQGTADENLFAVLKNYLHWTREMGDWDLVKNSPYANLAPIVNSSGTGKSRVVDQLGRKHCFVIPLCLRREGTNGYPPPDREMRDWLLRTRSSEQELSIAAGAFLWALFNIAGGRIEAIWSQRQPGDSKAAHTIFAEYMNDGGTFRTPSTFRREFYIDVVSLATQAETQIKERVNKGTYSFNLEYDSNLKNEASSFLTQCRGGIAVLSFDAGHELERHAIVSDRTSVVVTMLSQIHTALRSVRNLDIMGLYLSTLGLKYSHIHERANFPPITELGFNEFVLPLDNPPTLTHVTTAEYVSHLGRPIFATRWDAGYHSVQDDLLDFAQSKLAPNSADIKINVLACLAVRFPVEFRPRNERQEAFEHGLVENHMRYLTDADSTFAPSEPLLAEAAFEYLYYSCHSPEWVLETIAANLDAWAIHQGERGEFVMSLIWMAARDAVVFGLKPKGTGDRRPWDPYQHSVISVTDFMKKLLPADFHQQLENMHPSVGDGTDNFLKAFEGCRLWCNHFIQVQDYTIINTRFLCALLSNGIGVLCAPNTAGIDLLWIGLKGDVICEENLVLILGQAQNNVRFNSPVNSAILEAMDPVELGICAPNRPIPMIRMVFALASQTPGVTLVEPALEQSWRMQEDLQPEKSKFTSYDFWFAGVDPSTFGCVTAREARAYRDLLASSRLLYYPPPPVSRRLMDLDRVEGLKAETAVIEEARADLRRAAMPMRMASKAHFPQAWHDFLFKEKEEEG